MKRRTMLSLFAAPFLIDACSGKAFYFIQMADTQIGMIEGSDDGNSFGSETRILEDVFKSISAMTPQPAFVINCGDMTNISEHARQIQEYRRLTGMLPPSVKLCNVSGNHDFKDNCNPGNLSYYRQAYGADRYSFDHGGWHFAVLNSVLMKFPESCPEEAEAQRKWIAEDLAASSNRSGTLLFMHHPYFDNDIDEDDGYHNMPKAERRMWLDLFAENNVKAVFSGHRHTTIPEHEYRGVKLINTNAICNSFDKKPGLRIVGVEGDSIRQGFVARDAIPENAESLLTGAV